MSTGPPTDTALPQAEGPPPPAWAGVPPDVLDRLLRRLAEGAAPAALPALPRAGPAPAFPLSFAQQRLWFLDQLLPGDPAYVIPRAYRLRGPLDGDALARALDVLVRRHEALRTTFALRDGRPAQVVAARGMASYHRRDLSTLPAAERGVAARRLARREARRPAGRSRGP